MRLCLFLFALLFSIEAEATLFVGPGCTYPSIQQAIDAQPDIADQEIFVRAGHYHDQHISAVNATFSLRGGYSSCDVGGQFDGTTVLDGDGSGGSVWSIAGSTQIFIVQVSILRGSNPLGGGGIDFQGHGTLDLRDVDLEANKGEYGGGLNVVATGGSAHVRLRDQTYIDLNQASVDGGGARLSGAATLYMIDPDSTIYNNRANGVGGGLALSDGARAEIGSPGWVLGSGLYYGTISFNSAPRGAGLAVDSGSVARLFSTVPGQPVRIENNGTLVDTMNGGGIALLTFSATVCGWGVRLVDNAAQRGGAIDSIGAVRFTPDTIDSCGPASAAQLGAVECRRGRACNEITSNHGNDSIIHNGGDFRGQQISVSDNASDDAVFYSSGALQLTNCLFGSNTAASIINSDAPPSAHIANCTMAGNAFTAQPGLLLGRGSYDVTNSILWQPGALLGGDRPSVFTNVIAASFDGLPAGTTLTHVETSDPLFVDAPGLAFHLSPVSRAIDYTDSGPPLDLDGRPRGLSISNDALPFDIGAYEYDSSFFRDGFELLFSGIK